VVEVYMHWAYDYFWKNVHCCQASQNASVVLRHAKIQAKTEHNCHLRSKTKIMYKLRKVVM
jgi:hypothetical protein